MLIQYGYALLTMVPCPLWFWSRWASGLFLATVFAWSVWNGATFYIDVFGNRFQKELEALKKDVAKWQSAAELAAGANGLGSPPNFTPGVEVSKQLGMKVEREHGSTSGGARADDQTGTADSISTEAKKFQ